MTVIIIFGIAGLVFMLWIAWVIAFRAGLKTLTSATTGKNIRNYSNPSSALVIIDLQDNFTAPEGRHEYSEISTSSAIDAMGGASVFIRQTPETGNEALDKFDRWISENPNLLMHIRTLDDVHIAKKSSKLGVLYCTQDTTGLGWDLANVEAFWNRGMRMMGLAYNFRNRVADGCGEPADAGLSVFGRDVVKEMNRLGIVVDCTHTGARSTLDAIDISTKPPVFSHSGPRKLFDIPRNITDEQALAVKAKNGLVGVGGFPGFFSKKANPTIEDYLDAVEYWVQLLGPDHVALGLDFFQGETIDEKLYRELIDTYMWYTPDYPPPQLAGYPYPKDLEDARDLPNITEGLLRRGYSPEDVEKILGLNWMRVFKDNWPE